MRWRLGGFLVFYPGVGFWKQRREYAIDLKVVLFKPILKDLNDNAVEPPGENAGLEVR